MNVRHTSTPLQTTLHSEAKVHEAVQFFHQAAEALSAMGVSAHTEGAPQTPAMETAFTQITKLAEAMSQARRAVLEKPIPNREAAEYIAKVIAERASSEHDTVAAVSERLQERALALTS
ncbi:MAG: hypothetical protein SFV15_23015 [Polyangiaceae bacterium]|nr:hypothetical protein [Polyangiaceae bacterium]